MRFIIIQLFVSFLIFTLVSPTVAKPKPQLRNFSAGHYYLTAEEDEEISDFCQQGVFQTQITRTGPRLTLQPSASRDQNFYMTNVNFTDQDEVNTNCKYDSQNRVTYTAQKTTLTYDEHHKCNKGASVIYHTRSILEIGPGQITMYFTHSSNENSFDYSCHWIKSNH